MNTRFYVAYGSNLNIGQMIHRCPDAEIVGTSILRGYALVFRGSKTGAYLTIEPDDKVATPVAVWAVSPADIKRLDRYEGFPSFYHKEPVKNLEVELKDGDTIHVDGFAYVMNTGSATGFPSISYVQTCMDGYKDFGFDTDVLRAALRRTDERWETV